MIHADGPMRRLLTPCTPCMRPTQISSAKKRTGAVAPKKFVNRLKFDNELFRSFQHQV